MVGKAITLKDCGLLSIPFILFYIGTRLEKIEDSRLTMFRDKSALYKSDRPRTTPSWT